MATEDHSNSRNRVIEDCDTTRQPPALDAGRPNPDVAPPEISGPKNILAVPVFSSPHSTTLSTFTQESHSDQLHISSTSLSTSSIALSMSSVPAISTSSTSSSLQLASSSKSYPTSNAFVTEPALQSVSSPRLGSDRGQCVPFDSGLSIEKKVCPISTTNVTKPAQEPSISTITSLNLLHGTSHLNTTTASDSEPLNLSKSQKHEEKVISSSLFGVIPKTSLIETKSASCVGKLPAAVGKSSVVSPYKITHPIGSRKVTENVITYHEPMFQSVANNLFENQKNQMMGKRKVEEEKSKSDSFLPETKRKKLDNTGFVSKTEESKPVVKKKCSIENIIEKIRTKKTLSRGGSNSHLNEMNEQVNDLNTVKSDNQISESQSSENDNVVEKSSLSGGTADKLLEKSQTSLGNLMSVSDDSSKETCVASVNKNSENVEELSVNAQHTLLEFSQNNKNDSRLQKEPVTSISETDFKDKTKAESPTKKEKASPKLKKSESDSPKQKKTDSISPKEQKSDYGVTKQMKTENISPKPKKLENFVPKPEKSETKYPKQKKNAELDSKKNKPENISPKQLKSENASHSQSKLEKKSPKSKETEKSIYTLTQTDSFNTKKLTAETKSAILIKSEKIPKKSEFNDTPSDEVIKQTDVQVSPKPKNNENSEKCEIKGDHDEVSSGIKIEASCTEQMSFNVEGTVKEESNIKKVKKKLLDSCKSKVFEKNGKTLLKKKKIECHDGEKHTTKKKKKVDSENGKNVKVKRLLKEAGTTNDPDKLTKVDSNETPKKRGRKKKSEVTDDENIQSPKKKADGDIEKKKQKTIKKKLESKTKITKPRKPKLSIANRRVKREASLNATTFLHILNEKSPRTPKLNTQRSKSDSDIKNTQLSGLYSSHSMIDIGHVADDNVGVNVTSAKECKSPKKEKLNRAKGFNGSESDGTSPKVLLSPKIEPTSPSKTASPYRKVSFSEDDAYESVFTAVIQRSIEVTEKFKTPTKHKEQKEFKFTKTCKQIDIKSKLKDGIKKNKNRFLKMKPEKKEKQFQLKKLKKAVQITVSKSPEETAEKKRKANLARLERAKEIKKTERKVSEKMSAEEKESDDSVSVGSVSRESDIDEPTDTDETEANEVDDKCDEIKKVKAKKGALCRAARTHISVESKTVVENTMPSPRWCECCQSNYYPSQPNPGAQVWRIKHLVDKDSSKSPEPIQSSSNHFIAAHASCEIRPYSSPSHMSVLDSNPFVGQIMSHSHIQCSACSCGHSGVYHPGQCQQCQNCTLGSVSNMLPCQRYGSTYSVTYPHSHGSYTHCGCGACYPAGNYHHPVGQTLIHQPQMTMSTESSILLHRPVQLQVTHEASHPTHTVSMPTMPHSHSDSSLAHSVQPMTLQLSRSEQNRNSLTYMCQLSQGELTNVSLMGSNSPADHEIDVGSRDDVVKSLPNVIQLSSHSSSKCVNKNSKFEKTKTKVSTKTPIKVKRSHSSESPSTKSDSVLKKKRVKSSGDLLEGNKKLKTAENIDNKSVLKVKEKKKSNLLLIKQKQKQLEEKSAKLLKQQEYQESQKKFITSVKDKKLVKDKLKQSDSKTGKKDKERKNSKGASKKEETWELEQPKVAWHGWSWDGEGVVKKVTNIFDGQTVERKCYNGIRHEDGDVIKIKDCVLVCSGQKEKDIPYVAKISNFWEDSVNGEMMMSVLWFYRPEHAEGCQINGSLENEVFAAKHRDETLVACIEDRGYVLTYNEYCRFMAEVERTKSNLPQRKKVVPDPEEAYPSNRIPPVDVNPENVFLCRQVYDIKLKRVLKNPA